MQFYLIIAHFDHLGAKNNNIYPGATDNVSGILCAIMFAKELDKRGIFYKGMAYTNNLEEGETAGNFSKHNTGVQGGDGSW